MSRYSHQISFTSSARHSLLEDPIDPLGAIRGPIEVLGGTLVDAFFTEDSFDVLAITEFPDSVSANEISIAFYAGGSVARLHSSLLRSATEFHELRRKRAKPSCAPVPTLRALSATCS